MSLYLHIDLHPPTHTHLIDIYLLSLLSSKRFPLWWVMLEASTLSTPRWLYFHSSNIKHHQFLWSQICMGGVEFLVDGIFVHIIFRSSPNGLERKIAFNIRTHHFSILSLLNPIEILFKSH